MSDPRDDDALLTRYREASDAESRQPSARVREAVRAHARMVIEANARDAAAAPGPVAPLAPPANQPRFTWSMVASVAVVGLAGLLALQLDRGSPEQKELAMGQRTVNSPAAEAAPSTESATAPVPASTAKAQVPRNPAAVAPVQPAEPAPGRSVSRPSAATAPPPSTADTESQRDERVSRDKAAAPSTRAAPEARMAQAAPAQEASTTARRLSEPGASTAATPPALLPSPSPALGSLGSAARSGFQEQADSRLAMAIPPLPGRQAAAQSGAPSVDAALALRAAASAGAMAELERLLSVGASLNAPDDAGRTALMLAAMQGHADVVQRLLAAGANAALQDRDGLTALMHARRLKLERITSLLEARP